MDIRKKSVVGALVSTLLVASPINGAEVAHAVEPVWANDNRTVSGVFESGVVTVRLRAASGSWRPEGRGGPALTVEAFGEEAGALMVPGPLIRAVEGTTIDVSIRNDLEATLRVHGLCARDGRRCDTLDVPPGARRAVRFKTGASGTYHYWATTIGAPVPFRELAGALVVDSRDETGQADRVFVITEWSNLTAPQLRTILEADDSNEAFLAARPKLTFVINGLSWPATERLTYARGETARWRVINLSSQSHPMHLHGFYFTVVRQGDGRQDRLVAGGAGRRVVTELLRSGGTMFLEWMPEREGNWLFHCHIMHHVSPDRRLEAPAMSHDLSHQHDANDHSRGVAGMVLGITVRPSESAPASVATSEPSPRRITMTIQRRPDATTAVVLDDARGGPIEAAGRVAGPPLVLQRGEPVVISVHNGLEDATSIHWHGLEIDSDYDGVHGWSGTDARPAPMIPPGGTFDVRVVPPRTGTFIYHTHVHDYHQLASGLYGALVVIEPGERDNPASDHVIVIGRRDASEADGILENPASVVLNGEHAPRWRWSSGGRHRIRLINITPDDILTVSLTAQQTAVSWRMLTKDGAPVPGSEAQLSPATVTIAVGETYDFEYEAPVGRALLWLEVRSSSGRWQAQGRIVLG